MLNFFKSGIWTLRAADFPPFVRSLIALLRIIVLSVRCFFKNNCMLHASALTYYTLLAIVPVAALAFAIAKGFGLYARLETWFRGTFAGKEEVAEKIITFSNNLLENTKGGLIAGIGAIALLYVTIRLMMQIEKSLNDIWGVKTGRAILRKISDYLAIVLLCPLIIIVTTGATVYTTVRLSEMVNTIPGISDTMNVLLALSSRALPIVTTWLIFSFIYMFIPNTRVRIIPALTGGFIAGVLYYVVQVLYIAAQYNVAKYNAIYGSFAALPLFLIWLQISWTFILLGAEIAFACQNVSSYEGTPGDGSVGSRRSRIPNFPPNSKSPSAQRAFCSMNSATQESSSKSPRVNAATPSRSRFRRRTSPRSGSCALSRTPHRTKGSTPPIPYAAKSRTSGKARNSPPSTGISRKNKKQELFAEIEVSIF